jgi:hypothetical protein
MVSGDYLLPGVCLDVVLVEIVATVDSIIPSEDVNIAFESYTSMQRPLNKLYIK